MKIWFCKALRQFIRTLYIKLRQICRSPRHQDIKGGRIRTAALVLNFGARCSWLVNITPRLFYPREIPYCPPNRRLDGILSKYVLSGEEKNSLACRDSNLGPCSSSPSRHTDYVILSSMMNYDDYKLLNYAVSAIISFIVTGPIKLIVDYVFLLYSETIFSFGLHTPSSAFKQHKIDFISFRRCKQTCKVNIMVGSALCHSPKICFNFESTINKVNKKEIFFLNSNILLGKTAIEVSILE